MEFIAKHFDFRDVAVKSVDFYFNLEGNETSSTISKCREVALSARVFLFFSVPPGGTSWERMCS